MCYVRIPGRAYDLIVNTALICYVRDGPRGMAIYYAGHSTPQLLSGDQRRLLLEALHGIGAPPPARRCDDE